MQKSAKYALIACVAVVVLGGLAFWWLVLRSDAPPRASLPVRTDTTAPEGTGPSSSASPEGTWTLVQADDVFAGYRIQELFGGESIKTEAAGRTPQVDGTLVLVGTQVTAVDITADLSLLASDEALRDAVVETSGLETNEFPTATFVLTEPIEIGTPAQGEPVGFTATGDLTLHGVTRRVLIPLEASLNGTTISVAGGLQITLADFGIEAPETTFVAVDEVGEFEFQLVFEQR